MPLTGKLVPELVIPFKEITLLTFPVAVPVEKKTVPVVTAVPAPLMTQRVTVLLEASLMKRMLDAVAVALVFSMVRSWPANPSIVTLSAPFRSIRAPAIEPLTVRTPLGVMVNDAHELTDG